MAAITLVGPGGAGKSTVGAALADCLSVPFIDLDRKFEEHFGNITAHIRQCGYHVYARRNVETYCSLLEDKPTLRVVALSSGFMTYARAIHPEYACVTSQIEASPTTFVLIPSLEREECVNETVRRQTARPIARAAVDEETVIRERFPLYVALAAPKIETMRSVDAIVWDILHRWLSVDGEIARRIHL
jgi:shikimate kinase